MRDREDRRKEKRVHVMWCLRKQAYQKDAGKRTGNAESPAGSQPSCEGQFIVGMPCVVMWQLPLPPTFSSSSHFPSSLFLSLSLCVSLSSSLCPCVSLSLSLSPENVLLFNYRHIYNRLLGSFRLYVFLPSRKERKSVRIFKTVSIIS